ncbi:MULTISPECIES: AgmX/PglI C-terminal domain-containing protein [unclassified Myxococcus]|uniref:AgmX/PglI C-terminal domain-containing protein n=1 Tax=unclassified Myxococcus TaxID=2648731 RepID=UPI001CBBE6A7|nr:MULTISPECIES: AgmX/PglI C-terminal domain-containing protein [unclassified Myxococcus]MBZ4400247.1 AgmX/PglI C-terminal domain-containing protein [Myxococcus sp. AS-1-15]MBZ4407947.1 AgmX/PglI C-terminal domain-containing protein [Myxococcus sp. XM-1-1-1]
MSGQPSVLQVVILRDGLLVGTEVFVPGTYALGSDPTSDLRLDDPAVEPRHALLYFQNGRAAIQDAGTATGLFVNGHRVTACEIRSVDEVLCGPFVLKTRVLAQRPQEVKPQPPPEVAALFGAPQPAPPQPPAPQAAPVRQLRPVQAAPTQPLATTVPAVRAVPQQTAPSAATQAIYPQHAAQPAVVPMPAPVAPQASVHGAVAHAAPPAQPIPLHAPVPAGTVPSVRRRATQEPAPAAAAPVNTGMLLADDLLADVALDPLPVAQGPLLQEPRVTASRPTHAPRIDPGKGASQLYLELYWGTVRRDARRFAPDRKKPVVASLELPEAMPLWGFTLPETGAPFTLAESISGSFRLFVPPGTEVEKSGSDGRFTPVTGASLESDGSRRFITLREGVGARLTQGQMSLVAYAAPVPARVFVNPLRGLPWLALTCFALFASGLGAFIALKPPTPETADFTQKNLPPVALRLIAPEPKKKEEAKKKLEALKEKAKPVKKEEAKVAEKAPPKPVEKTPPPPQPAKAVAAAPPENKALKALAKLSAAGPATNDLLAAVDKLGSGPGSKNVKNSNYKLSGLIGKAPIANAGLGTFGLGGGGKGGGATLGAELLRGKGGGGIGALGAGSVGKGKVGGTVTRATARSIASTQGTVDREAVARVINSHLNEVHGCYERALLKDPGLAGKVVLEWTIGANGRVAAAKTKSSTLRNASVEACILSNLKTWTFPAPKGGVVIITYPFLFNSVGY